jgi:hypothetical protein
LRALAAPKALQAEAREVPVAGPALLESVAPKTKRIRESPPEQRLGLRTTRELASRPAPDAA